MVPPSPIPPPQGAANPQLFRNTSKVTHDILIAAKVALKVVMSDVKESAVRKVAAQFFSRQSPSPEISVDSEEVFVLGNTSGGETKFSQPKKAKLSENLKISEHIPQVSPFLQHK